MFADVAPSFYSCVYHLILQSTHADVDECAELRHNCAGLAMCENEVGSFRCICPTGYVLDANATSCDGQSIYAVIVTVLCMGGSKELTVLYESYSTATFVLQHGFVLYKCNRLVIAWTVCAV